MSIIFANEKYAQEIGKDFGGSNSGIQGNLLNGFAHGLQLGISRLDAERQIAYVVDELSAEAKSMLVLFGKMIELEKEGFQ